jgi:hypothetical protein
VSWFSPTAIDISGISTTKSGSNHHFFFLVLTRLTTECDLYNQSEMTLVVEALVRRAIELEVSIPVFVACNLVCEQTARYILNRNMKVPMILVVGCAALIVIIWYKYRSEGMLLFRCCSTYAFA